MNQRIGWVLAYDENMASSRLQGFCIHEFLLKKGFSSEIAVTNAAKINNMRSLAYLTLMLKLLRSRYDAVFFQKPEWPMFKMSEMLRVNGIRTAAIQCDPFPGDYEKYFDRVIVTTKKLLDMLCLKNAQIIDDMLEVPPLIFKQDYRCRTDKIRIVWTGQGMERFIKEFFYKLSVHPLLKNRVDIITVGPASWASIPWSIDSVYEHILSCDIAVIPLPKSYWDSAKSTNRLTLFMALGMPTVVCPLNSYLEIAKHNDTCLIAATIDDFANSIECLMDESKREYLGRNARRFVWSNYSPEVIGASWEIAVKQLFEARCVTYGLKRSTRILGRMLGLYARLV